MSEVVGDFAGLAVLFPGLAAGLLAGLPAGLPGAATRNGADLGAVGLPGLASLTDLLALNLDGVVVGVAPSVPRLLAGKNISLTPGVGSAS